MRVRFVLRKSRLNSQGKCPLDCRVRINGIQATPFSTHIMVAPEKWDSKAQRIKGASESVLFSNRSLDEIRYNIEQLFQANRAAGVLLRSQELVDVYLGRKTLGCKYLDLAEKKIESLKLNGRAPATIGIHKKCHRYLFDFLGENMEARQIEKRHVQGFWTHLKKKGYDHDYVNKTVSNCISLFKFAKSEGFVDENPFSYLSMTWENKEDVTCLDEKELEKLITTEWSPVLQKVVDSFLFMCYQGLHISDYRKFRVEEIVTEIGMIWIDANRTKNASPISVPLHEESKKIIAKYDGVHRLPRITGQRNNDHLAIIAERIGTRKHLTNKIARKTFTDQCLNVHNFSEESVAAMLGHKSTRWVRKYGKVSKRRIKKEWDLAFPTV